MRQELDASLRPAVNIALGVAADRGHRRRRCSRSCCCARFNVIRSGLTRLGKGEFGVTLDLRRATSSASWGRSSTPSASSCRRIARCSRGRRRTCSRRSSISRTRSRSSTRQASCCSAIPAMQPKLPADAIGRALQGLLPATAIRIGPSSRRRCATQASRGPVQVGDDAAADDARDCGHRRRARGRAAGRRATSRICRGCKSTIAYSRKLVALGRLTAGIAHEVKNPLNAMMIHLELLRTKIRSAAWRSSRSRWPRRHRAVLPAWAWRHAAHPIATTSAALQHVRSHRERDPPAR